MPRTRSIAGAIIALMLGVGACADSTAVTIEVPEGATFCSVFQGEYAEALGAAVPVTDEGFNEAATLIVAWAEVLADLAPGGVAADAADNVRYHRAQADLRSAAEFIPGSNAMHAWSAANC
jgi:hypothetical protein